MKRFSEQLKKQADSIRLSSRERADLRERLTAYLEYHPLPEQKNKQEPVAAPLTTESYRAVSFPSFYIKGFFATLALVLVVGVPLIAERSLPGDVLYPVKVSFNEELRSTLTLSPYEKVEWETERLGRRIAEARLLASEGKLTEEQEAEVAEAVKAHSDAAKQGIETIRETDAEAAAIAEITFSSALDVQSAVLRSEEKTASTTVDAIAGAVEEERSEAAQKQSESEILPSAERLLGRIEQETTRAYELLESVRTHASAQEIEDIERRLSDIERKIAAAIALREEEIDEKSVRSLLRESLQGAQKLIVFMTDIDVRNSVVINDLIPVELTDEERGQAVANVLLDVNTTVAVIEAALASSTDSAVNEKVSVGLLEIKELTTAASSSLQAGEVDAAEEAVAAALDLATDTAGLLGVLVETTGEPAVPIDDPTPADEPDPETTTPAEGGEEDIETGEGEGATTTEEVPEDNLPPEAATSSATSSTGADR